MKKQIRSPTSRSARVRRVLAIVAICCCIFCFCVSISASDGTTNVIIGSLETKALSGEFTESVKTYFSSLNGFLGYTDVKNLATSTSPDYKVGTKVEGMTMTYLPRSVSPTNPVSSQTLTNTSTKSGFVSVCLCIRVKRGTEYRITGTSYFGDISETKVPLNDGTDVIMITGSLVLNGTSSTTQFSFGYSFTNVDTNDSRFLFCAYNYSESLSAHTEFVKNSLGLRDDYINIMGGGEGNMTALLTEIIQLLFGGLTGAATALGGGANTFVTSLFVGENNTLAVYGGLVVIFAGVALAIGFTTRIFTWLTSLGN